MAKAALQLRLGLVDRPDAPLFGVVSRLTPQKGLDLLLACLPEIVIDGSRLAMLGSGDSDLERGFSVAAAAHNGEIAVEIGYDDALSHLIIAGADVVLVPSRFEPCGLTQLYALRYGTLPLVRRVGGLADTVVDATAVSLADGSANGFAFDGDGPPELLSAVRRAKVLFREPAIWLRMMRRAMTRDFSWTAAARRYVAVYRELRPGLVPA
jgi:starch synthase